LNFDEYEIFKMNNMENSKWCKKAYFKSDYHFRKFYVHLNTKGSTIEQTLDLYVSSYHMVMMGFYDISIEYLCPNINELRQRKKFK
ncbi:Hypothetical protein PACV_102, partial [Pacmanvirus A23]|uniref:Hypothetical protein n=1 Tax=Pacmanvirus A23 TaxID=1932881 RepID=UPI000A09468E